MTRVEIPATVHYARVDGDYVLMDLAAGTYFGLDAVASHIWQSLAEHGDPARAAAELTETYEVTPETARADVERWLADLAARGLVQLRATGPEPASPETES